MRSFPIIGIAAVAAFAALPATPAKATGAIKCESGPKSGWESRDKLETQLIQKGWKVRKSKVDGGCYEVYGTTPEGQRVEAYFHPETLEKLYVARRGKILFRKKGY